MGFFYLGVFVCFVVLKRLMVLGSLLCLLACFRRVGCCRFSVTFAVLWVVVRFGYSDFVPVLLFVLWFCFCVVGLLIICA